MASVNKVIIVGNLGQDPETRQFENGGKLATISVATSERWNDKHTGEQRESVEWHRIVFRDRLAETVAQYLRKGSQVYVEGKIKTRTWQDADGQTRYATEIHALSMQMLGSRQDNQQQTGGHGGYGTPAQPQAWGNQATYGQAQNAQNNAFTDGFPTEFVQSTAPQGNFGNAPMGQPMPPQQTGQQGQNMGQWGQQPTPAPIPQGRPQGMAVTPPMGGVPNEDMPF